MVVHIEFGCSLSVLISNVLLDPPPSGSINEHTLVFVNDISSFVSCHIGEASEDDGVRWWTADSDLLRFKLEPVCQVPVQPSSHLVLGVKISGPGVMAEKSELDVISHHGEKRSRVTPSQATKYPAGQTFDRPPIHGVRPFRAMEGPGSHN